MTTYHVTTTIQSLDRRNPPVTVDWYKGDSLAKAMHAAAGAIVHDEDIDHGDLPMSVRYRTLDVKVDIVYDLDDLMTADRMVDAERQAEQEAALRADAYPKYGISK